MYVKKRAINSKNKGRMLAMVITTSHVSTIASQYN